MAQQHQLSLLVLDLESESGQQDLVQDQYELQLRTCNAPPVILGTRSYCRRHPPDDRIVVKPYHYGPLVRKIEYLLSEVGLSAF